MELMSSHFLYERWLETARNMRKEDALHDCALDRSWTFRELLSEGERERQDRSAAAYLSGSGAQFIVNLLRAWRSGRVTCPLDPGQSAPDLLGGPGECAHMKLTSGSSGT